MSEKRWNVSPEQLRALREIRINCWMTDSCEGCPLASNEEYRLCRVQSLPEKWDLKELEAESDG